MRVETQEYRAESNASMRPRLEGRGDSGTHKCCVFKDLAEELRAPPERVREFTRSDGKENAQLSQNIVDDPLRETAGDSSPPRCSRRLSRHEHGIGAQLTLNCFSEKACLDFKQPSIGDAVPEQRVRD